MNWQMGKKFREEKRGVNAKRKEDDKIGQDEVKENNEKMKEDWKEYENIKITRKQEKGTIEKWIYIFKSVCKKKKMFSMLENK